MIMPLLSDFELDHDH